jgi:hypothetical protein
MFFTRWSGQRIDTGLIFFRKVRPGSQLHRSDTEAAANCRSTSLRPYPSGRRKGQGRRTYRRSRLDASLSGVPSHQAASLQIQSKILQAAPKQIESLTLKAYSPRLSFTAISISCSDPR